LKITEYISNAPTTKKISMSGEGYMS
jgi:hypothetical protein